MEICSKVNTVFLSLGSNKATKHKGVDLTPHVVLKMAVERLSESLEGFIVSSVYITKPMYVEDQESFHNLVLFGTYSGEVEDLFSFTQSIECEFGRDREKEFRNGPRSLDIDILLFSDNVIMSDTLQIPHPKIEERAFVLVPMLEIFPECADNSKRDYYMHCLQKLDSSEVVKKSSL